MRSQHEYRSTNIISTRALILTPHIVEKNPMKKRENEEIFVWMTLSQGSL